MEICSSCNISAQNCSREDIRGKSEKSIGDKRMSVAQCCMDLVVL